ncbi:hypothetical protein [Chryseobacterium sp. 3008163]|uniref:hypothetical protein n=1 Tax=Chryseobacterium sp. 3008163 TaxID=2478663 RepID=UPI000F0D0837|nr:hypothetical protein [Chryseobacterium sp. 3008163]AYN01175.1 hypothetical protein EAG08_13435 [Chryseobacterium sp. 3008163]
MTLFACQQKNTTVSIETKENFSEYIPPVKLDSLLDEKYLLNKYYALENRQKEFSFYTPISSAKTYENFIDEKGNLTYPDYPEHILSEIYFTKAGKLSSFENVKDDKKLTVIYNDKNLVHYYIKYEKDSYSKEDIENITEYKYDDKGNIVSTFNYKKTKTALDFWHYTEYKYLVENGNVVVWKNRLEKFARYYFNQEKITFDNKKRIIKKESLTQNVLAGGREIKSEENYFYENPNFPEKITKQTSIAKTDNSSNLETYEYDKDGNLTNYSYSDNPATTIIVNNNKYISKNKIEKTSEFKTLKDYKIGNVTMTSDDRNEHIIITYDNFGNILQEENIKNISEKKYISNIYKFDAKNNWIEKLVKEHTYIPKEYLNEDIKEDGYTKYRREINYSDFKEKTMNNINYKEAEVFKKKILEQEKFYEKFRGLN